MKKESGKESERESECSDKLYCTGSEITLRKRWKKNEWKRVVKRVKDKVNVLINYTAGRSEMTLRLRWKKRVVKRERKYDRKWMFW